MKKVPSRGDLPLQSTWNLESIYREEAPWEADFQAIRESLPRLQAFQGTLGDSPDRLLACLRLRDETHMLMDQVLVYARLRKDEDTSNNHYQALADRSTALATDLYGASSFLRPELLSIAEETLRSFLAAEPDLAVYRHHLDELLRQRAHVRSSEVEAVLAQAMEVARTPDNTYVILTNADMRFPSILDEQGNSVELSQGRYNQLRESRDRRVRKDAFEALHGTYSSYRNTLAASLAGSVRSDIFYARARNYASALEGALEPNSIPGEVYRNLIQTVHRNLPELHRYVALRKRLLGLEELHHYDLYVPMVPEVQVPMPYEEATGTVLAALAPMGEEYVGALRTGLESRWIDVYENEGKLSGAYSSGSYTTAPFVLLNYQDTLTDTFTVAHELGHSMHSHFTRTTQPYVYGDYTIFLAEVASTLNELLLNDYLLARTTDPRVRVFLINQHLERFRTTLFRQTMFAEFELAIHERIETGEALTADWLSERYQDLNAMYYGPEVAAPQEIGVEWARIPHFYYNFYVYQYATGISAAASLAHQILSEGKPAVDRYLRFLKSGSSAYSIDLLRDAGVDMTSPDPIQKALDHFGHLVTEMEQLEA